MPQTTDMLRNLEFFHGIADKHLQRVAAMAKVVEFPARHDIFLEHQPAKEVYFIISGNVSLVICTSRAGCRQLMEVGAGELVGWSPLVGRSRLSDTARTLAPTKAIAIDGEQILALCAEDPEFGFAFMKRAAETLASRLSAARIQLLELSGGQLPQVQIESD